MASPKEQAGPTGLGNPTAYKTHREPRPPQPSGESTRIWWVAQASNPEPAD